MERPAGLCATCRHHRIVMSGRGSRFVLCRRSQTDARYPKYPPLPIVECRGWEGMEGLTGEG